jgi:predicted metal-dependent HD superfamily phosphohydrolase
MMDEYWFSVCGGDSENAKKWLELLKQRYSEPWRFYHSVRHIEALLKGFEEVKSSVQDEKCVLFAILFHDVVNDPKSKTNEHDSVVLWEQFATENLLQKSLIEKVKIVGRLFYIPFFSPNKCKVSDMIGQTAHHMDCDAEKADFDKLVFLDLDLAILGSEK